MLDNKSIEVISRFKSALLMRSQKEKSDSTLANANRGKKLVQSNSNVFTPKIVEYDGTNHLVLTNEAIERSNYNNKRRWKDFYRSENNRDYGASSDDDWSTNEPEEGNEKTSGDEDDEEEDNEENPLKRLRLSEILAPLVHPSELVTHPAISKTFKSASLSSMAAEIIETIMVEQKTLNQLQKFLQVLDGEDWFYQLEENMELPLYDHGLDDSTAMEENVSQQTVLQGISGDRTAASNCNTNDETSPMNNEFGNKRITRTSASQTENSLQVTDPFFGLPKSLALYEQQQEKQLEEVEDDDELNILQQELINYLQVSIQRHHEYIKNLSTIRAGLLKADRYKRDLYKWAKEMNDKRS